MTHKPLLPLAAALLLALSLTQPALAATTKKKTATKPAATAKAPAKAAKPAAAAASAAKPPMPSSAEVLAAATAGDWRDLPPEHTLLMEVASGQVVIELASDFAPRHAANIEALTRAGYFDGLAIIRVQDNYVTQWGDAEEDDSKAKPKPAGLTKAPVEFDRALKGLNFTRLPEEDGWAPQAGFVNGWPVGADPKAGRAWLTHCYSMVGAARGNEPDSSDGSGLYTVIGHAPRALDLNITTVGRVVSGMERLSALPRGTGQLGFYVKAEERSPIKQVRLLADVPEAERPKIQVLRTETDTFRRWLDSRRHRSGWFVHSPERVDLCSALPPTRRLP
ncbi:peptidylprolyl isomerase [Pelomonas sp. SE-A7]|uniref:peptidylprolyl isomerase n=1 Tax=Pelomonas sp. SE-A7 TaxID=3054953 RepID=UPI00259CEA6F|nr:peptidylprolyl isomerase [Pelomonas sp. SE-A7]MDM4765558.1 peptidylprolyl isomerase [Pelomonas sp. SE-A7]